MAEIYLVWHYDHNQSAVVAAYSDEALAEAHAERRGPDYGVEGIDVRNVAPTWRPYYHGMAQVGCTDSKLDRAPFVQVAGEADDWQPDPNGRVATCPGDQAIWLSVHDADESRALERVTEKYRELVERRKGGPLPTWGELTREEFANG